MQTFCADFQSSFSKERLNHLICRSKSLGLALDAFSQRALTVSAWSPIICSVSFRMSRVSRSVAGGSALQRLRVSVIPRW